MPQVVNEDDEQTVSKERALFSLIGGEYDGLNVVIEGDMNIGDKLPVQRDDKPQQVYELRLHEIAIGNLADYMSISILGEPVDNKLSMLYLACDSMSKEESDKLIFDEVLRSATSANPGVFHGRPKA